MTMQIQQYTLENEEKVERAIHGTIGSKGALVGGVGEAADEAAVLAEYDRLGGLITVDGEKVKTGSFYDFKEKAPRAEPTVVFLYSVNGQVVEVPEGEPLPLKVRAQQVLDGQEEEGDDLSDGAEVAPKKRVTRKRA